VASAALGMFGRLGGSAAGRWLFSRLVCVRAPYFASISPTVMRLEPGRCDVRLAHRRRVTNHIGTVHAIALCNAAELAAGLATDATLPASLRWIPKGMTVRYQRKAIGTMLATARVPLDPPANPYGNDLIVPIDVRNEAGDVVLDGEITMWVTPRAAV